MYFYACSSCQDYILCSSSQIHCHVVMTVNIRLGFRSLPHLCPGHAEESPAFSVWLERKNMVRMDIFKNLDECPSNNGVVSSNQTLHS